jgi:hypothetical protein
MAINDIRDGGLEKPLIWMAFEQDGAQCTIRRMLIGLP